MSYATKKSAQNGDFSNVSNLYDNCHKILRENLLKQSYQLTKRVDPHEIYVRNANSVYSRLLQNGSTVRKSGIGKVSLSRPSVPASCR